MRHASPEVKVASPTPAELGYLAGIMDGEGYFSTSTKSHTYGMRVAMIDSSVIDWLHEHFAGYVSRAGRTSTGNQVHTWTLSRQADLRFVLNRLTPLLVCKRRQAEAMLELVAHTEDQPRWDTRPTSQLSNVGKGGIERARRRQVRAEWKARERELRAAVVAAR